MVGRRGNKMVDAALLEMVAESHQRLNQCEVDNAAAGFAVAHVQDLAQLLLVAEDFLDFQAKIRAINALVEHADFFGNQAKLPDDVGLHVRSRRGGERNGCGIAD